MTITKKAKKTLNKYFGEQKTQEIINDAIIKFNKLDEDKVMDILGICNFYEDFWDFVEKPTKDTNKDFEYILNLLISKNNPFENITQIKLCTNYDKKLKINKITNGGINL